MTHKRLHAFIMVIAVFALRCGIFEPLNRKGSLAVVLVPENREQGLGKALEAIHSARFVLKKGSATVKEDVLPKSGGYFEGTIRDLDPGRDYAVQVTGFDSQENILGMGSESSISVSSGQKTTVILSWVKFKPVLFSPSDGATGVSAAPTLSWNSVSGASSYGLQ
ncbi:hypothetical protein JW906_07690, partial [bacterium]|nr:hypothetical protein [bacterium]